MRVISLIPSSTEIVCALGYGDSLVGRSHECDYPRTVQALPICSSPKINTKGSSREIDERVKQMVKEALSVYRVDTEMLKKLAPDVIVTQAQCEVCAVSLKDVEQAVCAWLDAKPRLVTLSPNSLEDIWQGMRDVARALGDPQKGEALAAECRERMRCVCEKAGPGSSHPSVVCIEWIAPLMAAGNWMPELIEMLGGINLFGTAGEHSPWMSWEALRQKDPDILVIMPCGWDMEKSSQEMKTLVSQPGWGDLKAVRQARVYLTDGNQFFNRPGPRLVESLEILAEIMYPHISLGHEGNGWRKYTSA